MVPSVCGSPSAPPRRIRHALLAALTISFAGAATAQRVGENAVTSAEDAFGISIGREAIGLYNSADVRGFSPVQAGNARIEGLYFDQVFGLTSRLRTATNIRVGLSAQSFPFPAPTGIVDYSLRRPGDDRALSVLVAGDEWGGASAEFDGVLPLVPGTLSLGYGGGIYRDEYYNGTNGDYYNGAMLLRWRPAANLDFVSFWNRSEARDDDTGPIYVPGTPELPPRIPRRRFDGPGWADFSGMALNYGGILRAAPAEDWLIQAGVFYSKLGNDSSFAHLFLDLQQDGTARRLIVADPRTTFASTSGELRVSRSFAEGPRRHILHVNARARDRLRRYAGSDVLDFGATRVGERFAVPRPDFEFGTRSRDDVTQATAGVAYEGRWRGIGEFGLGLQRTDYGKDVARPGLPVAETGSNEWLYNATAAWTPTPHFAVYAGYTRGLEESGVAPAAAVNRDEALPAIRTRQMDAGIRYVFDDGLRLVAGVFDVRKPYVDMDSAGVFGEVGEVVHRGIELSIAGSLSSQLDIVAGAVLMRPRVDQAAGGLEDVGKLPVGQPERTIQLNVDWRPPTLESLSFDASVSYTSDSAATLDNRVELPERTLVDIGSRYRFRIGDSPAMLRLSLSNVFDEYAFDLRGSGAYDLTPGRQLSAYLTVDWK